MLDRLSNLEYARVMNKLTTQKRAQILQCLVEGMSINSASRLTGASTNTITKLLVKAGEACMDYQNRYLVKLPCNRIQVDEIWSFVYSKQNNVPEGMGDQSGDIWTWTAICTNTKLIPSWFVGGRDAATAYVFLDELRCRLSERVQLTSEEHKTYLSAVEGIFSGDVDYAQVVKIYGETPEGQRRYSPYQCIGAKMHAVVGDPDPTHISTSYAERANLSMRMGMQRFTRVTNAFSKKVENHVRAISLHFMHYNFCRVHKSIKTTPAVAVGVADKTWTMEDVVRMIDEYWHVKKDQYSN